MASVLARLTQRKLRLCWALAATAGALVDASVVCAYQEPNPLSDSEVNVFISDFGRAAQGCDAKVVEDSFLPSATLTFELKGKAPVTLSVKDYMDDFRQNCFHSHDDFEDKAFSLSVEKYRAVMKGRWSHGSIVRFFFLDAQDFDSIEQTTVMIRYDNGIRIQEVRSFAVPTAAQAKPKRPPWE